MTGSIRKRGKGWEARIPVGKQINTKGELVPKYKTKTFRTRKEAEVWLAEQAAMINAGDYIPESKMSVGEWLDRWLDVYIMNSSRKKLRTKESYKHVVEKHLIPKLGKIQLQQLTPTHLQQYYNSSTLSDKTLSMHQAIIHQALKAAMIQENLIKKNPAELVAEKPNGKKSPEMQTWNRQEVGLFLKTAKQKGLELEALFTLAIDSGMRKGEICGLKWEDVNFNTGMVSIRRTLLKAGVNPVLGTPKNNKSRNVSISDSTLELLRKWKIKQGEIRLNQGPEYSDKGFVFTKRTGGPLQINNMGENQFDKLIEVAGVKKIRFHDLRHTSATLLLESGVNVKIVSERLGHSDIAITLNRYSHVTPNMQKEAAQAMGNLLSCQ